MYETNKLDALQIIKLDKSTSGAIGSNLVDGDVNEANVRIKTVSYNIFQKKNALKYCKCSSK